MWPNSPYAVPTGSFAHPVPLVPVDPDDNPNVTVCFRREWLPYIVGALQQLLLQTTWKTNDPQALDLAQARSQLLISMFISGCPEETPVKEDYNGDETMASLCESLRFNNGKWEALCCGDWTVLPGQGAIVPDAGAQPAPGGVLAPGECASHAVVLQGNGQYLLPEPVQEGYTVVVSGVLGGWYDGENWRCPDGGTYLLGICNSFGKRHDSGDLSATAYHMQLLALINGVYYPISMGSDTTINVPSGTPASEVTFLANDGSLTDNAGSIKFNVQVCAPQNSSETVAICYPAGGTGPATIQKGTPFTVASGANPNGHKVITMGFDQDVVLTILDQGTWEERTGSGETVYAHARGQNACDINHIFSDVIVLFGAGHLPLQVLCSCIYIDSENTGWSMQFRVD